MDTENIPGIFLSFLLVAVMLLSYSTKDVSLSNSVSLSQQSSFCNNIHQTSFVKDRPSGVEQGESNSNPSQGATTVSYSCNISLQILPIEKQNLESPAEDSFVFQSYNSTVSSQAFVFQEPDPPQTI